MDFFPPRWDFSRGFLYIFLPEGTAKLHWGGGVQRTVLPVNQLKKMGARSA